ncbi:MAG: GntR family transcriptional regulator [Pseudomonadota bacterium]
MPTSQKDACYIDLKQRILATDLEPGADLDEVTLTTRYGISRTPLREVFQRLAGDGYVRLSANRGAKVSSMDLATMRTFFQTAPMIYASIARLAAENRDENGLAALREAQEQFRRATEKGDAPGAALANHRFHAMIGQMAANPYLTACLGRLLIDHTRLSQTFYRAQSDDDAARITTACDQHDALIAAIEAGDSDQAIDLTIAHWDLSRDRMEAFVRPDPLPTDIAERAHAV